MPLASVASLANVLESAGLKENPRGAPKWAKHKGVKKIEIRVGSDTISLQLDERGGGASSSTLHITEADEDYVAGIAAALEAISNNHT